MAEAGEETIAAVVDTGYTLNHPDLGQRFWKNESEIPDNFIDFDQSTVADAIAAIEYAVAQGARVINCGWGTTSYSRALKNAMAAIASMWPPLA